MEHGINEASNQLGLPKKYLHAFASGPIVKPDGSPIPVEEWVKNHFIVIKMKQDKKEEGLLGKYRKQHDFLEGVMRKGIKDLDVLTSKEVVDDVANIPKELRLLREENSSLRGKLNDLQQTYDAKFTALEKDYATLTKEIERLKEENESLKGELETMQKRIAQLSGMDLVMMQKMLEACRDKCRTLLSQRGVHSPNEWNKLICDPICVGILEKEGLTTTGLRATAFGKKSHQERGSEVAHTIMESPDAYATIVCKMHGKPRERMMNVFEFVFGSRAEDLAFEDIL